MSSSQFFPEPEQSNREVVHLYDEEGRSLPCFVEQAFFHKDDQYLLLLPVDSPITIIAWDSDEDDSEATWVEDSEELQTVFPDAKAVLAEQNLVLNYAGYTLTVAGELPETEEDSILTLEIETETGQVESEEFQFLTHFYHEDQEYEIYTPLNPLLLFGKRRHNEKVELLTAEELEEIQPYLEEFLVQTLEQEDMN
ncbi:DUF3727 domain-containing protein [Spirulina subsalsa]|uniref:DUF3727 domain-containing protein n=1 Tax=Spirulina subsalsa TaxID=54311 RepID=UPI0003129BC3|nr:DUF3727 domain-containing protein [Spirulina subsalsa]